MLNDVQLKKHLLWFISTAVLSNRLLILKNVASVTCLESKKFQVTFRKHYSLLSLEYISANNNVREM